MVSPVQYQNALSPIDDTALPIDNDDKDEHCIKAPDPIEVTALPNCKVVIPEQARKA